MNRFLAIASAVLLVASVVLFLLYRSKAKKCKEKDSLIDSLRDYSSRLEKRVELLEKEAAIRNENDKKRDEKIDALHDGDAASNAVDELRRHKGS